MQRDNAITVLLSIHFIPTFPPDWSLFPISTILVIFNLLLVWTVSQVWSTQLSPVNNHFFAFNQGFFVCEQLHLSRTFFLGSPLLNWFFFFYSLSLLQGDKTELGANQLMICCKHSWAICPFYDQANQRSYLSPAHFTSKLGPHWFWSVRADEWLRLLRQWVIASS